MTSHKYSPLLLALILFVTGVFALPLQAEDPVQPEKARKYLKEVKHHIGSQFYDRDYNGVNLEKLLKTYQKKVKNPISRRNLYRLANNMLAELDASHCVVYSPYVYETFFRPEFEETNVPRAGLILKRIDGKFFVEVCYGPARDAGINRGDEIVHVNGDPPSTSDRCIPFAPGRKKGFVFRVGKGDKLRLSVRTGKNKEPRNITVPVQKTHFVRDAIESIHTYKTRGMTVAYVHLWHFLSWRLVRVVRKKLQNDLAGADGLLLDLRGMGGRPMIIRKYINMFSGEDQIWNKPVVGLIDENTRSAKEVFAHHWKKREIGPLVGETTAGAVLGSTTNELTDGSAIMIPIRRVRRLSGGKNLEGVGVEPTIFVRDLLPYNGDPILERGEVSLLREIKLRQKSSSEENW